MIEKEKKIFGLLDHYSILNWIEYISHKVSVIDKKNVNFDGRDYIELPSGKKVIITITVEEYHE